MKNNTLLALCIVLVINFFNTSFAQKEKRDKGNFIDYKNEFWDEIQKSSEDFRKVEKPAKKTFRMDFSGYDLPKSINEFTYQWHNEPISQGWTGTCWCFSTTSFLESEVYRIYKKKIKISELYTVYWEYVEKARRFVQEHGDSYFAEGSEANAVTRIWKQYGCVPAEAYSGLKPGQKFHDHTKMFEEMNAYLKSIKASNSWDEDAALKNIKSILNYYIGEPPSEITADGKKMTAIEYLRDVIKLNPDDYTDFMSLMEKPYYKQVEYIVEDNWWHSDIFYNIPLDEFMSAIKSAVKKGYTFAIGGDVSESGYDSHAEVAMIPTYDIPSEYIDENARQFRFDNKTTTDDHGIHVVGYKEKDGKFWFLIKDSGSGSRNGTNKGYYFYHEDYLKLKIMNFMLHRSAVEDLLKKFK